jgi:hypothetical protein
LTLSFQPHYGPGVDSASNRNEYRESSWGIEGGRLLRPTSLPSVRRLSRKCGNLNVSQPCGPSRHVAGIDFTLISALIFSKRNFFDFICPISMSIVKINGAGRFSVNLFTVYIVVTFRLTRESSLEQRERTGGSKERSNKSGELFR